MKRMRIVTVVTALLVIACFALISMFNRDDDDKDRRIKVGFIYDGDESAPYTNNFIKAQKELGEANFDGRVEIIAKSNIPEEDGVAALQELIDKGCDIIFTTSYGYSMHAKEMAAKHPEVEFCQATGDNANENPVLPNYHTFMGEIYEGRYVSGVVAGMKLKEMIDEGEITESEAKLGYVGAFPYAEVISGYTAFILGVRSVVPSAVMTVKYTYNWTSYTSEKQCAKELIDEGCVIISQHSDTIGPAVMCETAADEGKNVYHVGYNQSMIDVAPTTSLVSTRINWSFYVFAAVTAVLEQGKIEDYVDGNIHGNDAGAGFEYGWVQMFDINGFIAAEGTQEKVDEVIDGLIKKRIEVFKGDYIGVNPDDESDTYDLSKGYIENEKQSAPSFYYVLRDVITVEEMAN